MMPATSRHVSGRSSPDLSAEPSRSDSPRGQHDVRMGICFIHVMERHINNHALTDKVFSDKGENGFRAASCGSSWGMASSISRASCEFFRRSAFSTAFQSSARFVHQAGAVAGVRITASATPLFCGCSRSPVRYAHQASVNRNDRQRKLRRCSRCFWNNFHAEMINRHFCRNAFL